MPTHLGAGDVRESLNAHVAARGAELFAKYGPAIGWRELGLILQDRGCVRYPCEVVFEDAPLLPGELAYPVAKGARPEDGFVMHVRSCFRAQPEAAAWIVLYQLVLVNYGEFASPADAETFGANALGIPVETYYQRLCLLADQPCGCTA